MKNDLSLPKTVDELGAIKASIAELTKREKALIEILKAAGQPVIEGVLFRAAVSVAERLTIDADEVKRLLGANTPMKSTITETVRVSSR